MRKLKAFTLIELLVTLAIVGIVTVWASISLFNFIEQQRLEGAANQIFSDLKLAQSEALKQGKTVFVNFESDGDSWCYGMSMEAPCNCSETNNSCQIDEEEWITDNEQFKGIVLQKAGFAGGGSNNNFTAFDPKDGFAQAGSVKNGSIWLRSSKDQMAVIVNRLGRIRFCSPTIGKYKGKCTKAPKFK